MIWSAVRTVLFAAGVIGAGLLANPCAFLPRGS